MSKDFLKEIEVPGILEILGERWDNALELMHDDALVYGGAVRDVIAGFPLKGDLDIVGGSDPYSLMVYAFTESAKWTPEGWVPPVDTSQGVRGFQGRAAELSLSTRPSTMRSSPSARPSSRYTKHMAVDSTTSFHTFDNAKVQLIRARPSKVTGFKAALQVVKEVDIVCCGLMMDKYGRVFEVVEGAYDDCVNKILRFNKTARSLILEDLQIRISKLKERGWTSKISIARLRKIQEKAEAARRSEEERMLRTMKKDSDKGKQKVRSWLSVSPGKKQKSIQEVILSIDGLRSHSNPGTSLGYIKDVIKVTADDFGWAKNKNYNYTISGKGIINIAIHVSRGKAVDYAYVIAERIEEYGGGKHKKKSSGRIWKKPTESHPTISKTSITKRSMHDNEGYAVHTHNQSIGLDPSDEDIPVVRNEGVARGTFTFKASMRDDGQIEINGNPTDIGGNIEDYGSVEIDISSIPEEAQIRVKEAFKESRRDYQKLSVGVSSNKIGKTQKVKQAGGKWGYSQTKTTREE